MRDTEKDDEYKAKIVTKSHKFDTLQIKLSMAYTQPHDFPS